MQMLHVRQVHAEAAKNNYNYKYINTYIYKDRRGEYHPDDVFGKCCFLCTEC